MENFKPLYGESYFGAQQRELTEPLIKAVEQAMPINPDDRILEIGIGNGEFLTYLSGKSENVYGIDINPASVSNAKQKSPRTQLVTGDATTLPYRDKSFDRVFMVHTLEHIADLESVFSELSRVTNERGTCHFVFPVNYFSKAASALPDALKIYPLNPIRAWHLANQLHQHNLTPEMIIKIAFRNGFGWANWKKYPVRYFPVPVYNTFLNLHKPPSTSIGK